MEQRITKFLLLLLPLALPRAAEAAPPRTAAKHFRLALRSQLVKEPERAAYHYRSVIDLEPDHRAARRALGYRRVDGKWVRGSSARREAARALRRIWHKKRDERGRGMWALLALPPRERARALRIALRNRHEDVRLRALDGLARQGGDAAVAALIRHLAALDRGGPGAYIAQNGQIAYVQDFDVEVA